MSRRDRRLSVSGYSAPPASPGSRSAAWPETLATLRFQTLAPTLMRVCKTLQEDRSSGIAPDSLKN